MLLTAQMSRHCRAAAERSEQERESAGAMNSIGNIHTALAKFRWCRLGAVHETRFPPDIH